MRVPFRIECIPAWRRLWSDQSGQAIVEYSTLTYMLLFLALGAASSTPVVPAFFKALQNYVDVMFYALNVAVG